MFLLVQTIDFDSGKVASRDHAKDFAVVDVGQVPETSIVHGPQSVAASLSSVAVTSTTEG